MKNSYLSRRRWKQGKETGKPTPQSAHPQLEQSPEHAEHEVQVHGAIVSWEVRMEWLDRLAGLEIFVVRLCLCRWEYVDEEQKRGWDWIRALLIDR